MGFGSTPKIEQPPPLPIPPPLPDPNEELRLSELAAQRAAIERGRVGRSSLRIDPNPSLAGPRDLGGLRIPEIR